VSGIVRCWGEPGAAERIPFDLVLARIGEIDFMRNRFRNPVAGGIACDRHPAFTRSIENQKTLYGPQRDIEKNTVRPPSRT